MDFVKPLLVLQLACATLLSTNHPVLAVVDGLPVRAQASQDRALELERTVRIVQQTAPDAYKYLCTGVMIDDATVVTAGSCLLPDLFKEPASATLFAELYAGTDVMVRTHFQPTHVGYDEKEDLATGVLKDPPTLTASVPLANGQCDADSPLSTLGFGIDENNRYSPRPRLSTYTGIQREGSNFVVNPNTGHICAGDAGAPVFCRTNGRLSLLGITKTFYFRPGVTIAPQSPLAETCRRAAYVGVTILKATGVTSK